MERDCDVAIVGGGGAGLAAALTAAAHGSRVLLFDAAAKLGGATALSGGVLYAAGTRDQQQRGIHDDTPEKMFAYCMILNQYKLDADMVLRLCRDAADALHWLMDLGVSFPPENLYAAGLDGVLRGHRAKGMGAEIVQRLEGHLGNHDRIDVARRSRVTGLAPSGEGWKLDVDGATISAAAVILTTGGFGANRALLHHLYPDAMHYPDWGRYIGPAENVGDGLKLAQFHGAAVTGFNRGALLLTPNFSADFEPYTPPWLALVDREGQRFIDETLDYSVMAGAVLERPGHECFAVFDEDARLRARQHVKSADAKRIYPYASWSGEKLEEMAERGTVYRADTLEGLSCKLGMRPGALAVLAAQVNRDVDAGGRDTRCLKSAEHLAPIRRAPFYAARMRPAVVGTTHTGLRTDTVGRVIGEDGSAIPGLYAAGEIVGNILGDRYVGGGNSLSNSFVFGRLAGESASSFARKLE